MELIARVSIYWLISGFTSIAYQHYFEEGSEDFLVTFLVGPIVMPYFIVMKISALGARVHVKYIEWKMVRLRKEIIGMALDLKKDIESGEELTREDILSVQELMDSVMEGDEENPVLLDLNRQLQTILAEYGNKSLDK